MIFQNIKLTIRRIRNEKGFFSINLFGLVTGIAAFLILSHYVYNEKTYDSHIPDYENIYRVHTIPEGSEVAPWARSLGIVLPASLTFPEVEDVTQFAHSSEGIVKIEDQSFRVNDILSVDTGFFRVFSVQMVTGDYTEIIKPNAVFISENVAKKYFKGADPIGKIIELENLQYFQKAGTFEIRGIVKNMSPKTHFSYDILTSQKGKFLEYFESLTDNRLLFAYHYVKLKKNSNPARMADKYTAYCDASNLMNLPDPSKYNVDLLPITDIHLKSDYRFELKENSNKINIGLFMVISFIILIISLLNFINLSIAKIIKRSKEYELRRFIGASNRQLTLHILTEVILKSLLAIGISLLLIEILNPVINNFFNVDFNIYYSEPVFYFSLIGIELTALGLTSIFVGFYFFEKTTAIEVLSFKNNFSRSPVLKSLLIMQVIIVIFLLSAILLVNRQINYVLSKSLGFDKENVLVIHLRDKSKDPIVFADELRKQSEIMSVGFTQQHFGYPTLSEPLDGFGINGNIEYVMCDLNYLRTMNIELTENWIDKSQDIAWGIVVNNHFYKRLIERHGSIEAFNVFQKKQEFKPDLSHMKLSGLAKDFNYNSAHVPIGDFAFVLGDPKRYARFIHIRLAKGNLREAMKKVEKTWRNYYENQQLNYFFIEDKITEQYKAEILLRKILLIFSIIGVVISIIGITAFSLFISQQRTKEIGIRKVNGARVSEVLVMLNKDFVKWVVIAFMIATPVAWYAMHKWLENFAYKTELSWWIFALAGVMALGIALLTVSWQSWRAATRNPVEALRYE